MGWKVDWFGLFSYTIVFIGLLAIAFFMLSPFINFGAYIPDNDVDLFTNPQPETEPRDIQIDGVYGTVEVNEDGENKIRQVDVAVSQTPNANDISLENVRVIYLGPRREYTLTHQRADFSIIELSAAEPRSNLLTSPNDRYNLRIPLEDTTTERPDKIEANDVIEISVVSNTNDNDRVTIEIPQQINQTEDNQPIPLT